MGDSVRCESGELLVEDLGDAERVGGVGDQECAGVRADRPVSGDIDDRVGSLHLEGDPVLAGILASAP